MVNRIGSEHITKLQDVQSLNLEKTLTSGTENKKGVAFLGKIFSNLSSMATTQFHKIQSTFEAGKWTTNNSIMKKLEKNFAHLSHTLQTGISKEEAETIARGAKEMRAICNILKQNGASKAKIAKLEKNLSEIEWATASAGLKADAGIKRAAAAKEAERKADNLAKFVKGHAPRSKAEIKEARARDLEKSQEKQVKKEEKLRPEFEKEIHQSHKHLKEAKIHGTVRKEAAERKTEAEKVKGGSIHGEFWTGVEDREAERKAGLREKYGERLMEERSVHISPEDAKHISKDKVAAKKEKFTLPDTAKSKEKYEAKSKVREDYGEKLRKEQSKLMVDNEWLPQVKTDLKLPDAAKSKEKYEAKAQAREDYGEELMKANKGPSHIDKVNIPQGFKLPDVAASRKKYQEDAFLEKQAQARKRDLDYVGSTFTEHEKAMFEGEVSGEVQSQSLEKSHKAQVRHLGDAMLKLVAEAKKEGLVQSLGQGQKWMAKGAENSGENKALERLLTPHSTTIRLSKKGDELNTQLFDPEMSAGEVIDRSQAILDLVKKGLVQSGKADWKDKEGGPIVVKGNHPELRAAYEEAAGVHNALIPDEG